MSGRWTLIGHLLRTDRAKAREHLVEAIQRHEGNLRRAAADVDISRKGIYRMIGALDLWSVVDEARTRREPEWAARVRLALVPRSRHHPGA